MRHFAALTGALLVGSLATPSAAQSAPAAKASPAPAAKGQALAPPSPLAAMQARDLRSSLPVLARWWPGIYDNHEQVVRQSGGGLSAHTSTPFRRMHTEVKAVVAPALGEHVLSVEQFADNDRARTQKREILVLAADPGANAIRVRRFSLADWARLTDAAATARLQMADLAPLGDGCDILLRYAGGQFQGSLAGAACAAGGGVAQYDLIVGREFVWERGQARHARSGKVTWEMAPGSGYDWYQESRARPYTCNVFASESGEMAKTRFLQTIHLHDQGGEAEIGWPDGRTLVFTIHERAFSPTAEPIYPLFRVHEKGNPVPIAYAYAVDRNTRFGLNLGWFYIRCYDDADIAPLDMLEARK